MSDDPIDYFYDIIINKQLVYSGDAGAYRLPRKPVPNLMEDRRHLGKVVTLGHDAENAGAVGIIDDTEIVELFLLVGPEISFAEIVEDQIIDVHRRRGECMHELLNDLLDSPVLVCMVAVFNEWRWMWP